MMKKIRSLSFILSMYMLCAGSFLKASAQREIAQNTSPEIINVHLAKTFFITSETVWFKIYLNDAASGFPSIISKVAYVELLDSTNKAVYESKIFIDSSVGSGSFVIPPYLYTGIYYFRAYTSNAKNFGPQSYFHQRVAIFNPSKATASINAAPTLSYKIKSVVAGKHFTEGLANTIVFNVTDQYNRPVAISGKLMNQHNETIATVQTDAKGIGKVEIIPAGGMRYFLSFDLPDGKTIRSDLPPSIKTGYVVKWRKDPGGKIRISVLTNDVSNNKKIEYYWRNGIVKFLPGTASTNNGSAEIISHENELGDGINYFTVMSEQQEVAEMIYYKAPAALAPISIDLNKSGFSFRENVGVKLLVNANRADLSVSVILMDTLESILPSFQTLEDHGFVNERLLLTGAASISADNNQQSYIPEYAGHIITGKVIDIKTGRPANGILTYLSVPGDRFQFSNSRSDSGGNIKFDVKKFFGTDNIIIQTAPADSGYRVMINNPFSESYLLQPTEQLYLSPEWQQALLQRITAAQLQNAFAQNNKEQFYLPDFYDTTSFFGKPDKVYMLDDYTRFATMEEVMREYVAEVKLSKAGSNFRFRTLNAPYKSYFEENPLVLLDGVPVFNINRIMEFDPLKVKRLDLITRRYYHSGIHYDGIASFASYTGDLAGYQLEPNAVVIDYPGLQLQRQFNAPSYDSAALIQSRVPDMRTLLYWNADIKLSKGTPLDLSFYTSDVPGTYAIIVEGFTSDGKKIRSVRKFEVTK